MPLLGKKLYIPKVLSKTVTLAEPHFLIPFTNEVFSSKMYPFKIWVGNSADKNKMAAPMVSCVMSMGENLCVRVSMLCFRNG